MVDELFHHKISMLKTMFRNEVMVLHLSTAALSTYIVLLLIAVINETPKILLKVVLCYKHLRLC